ncbi:MAG: hypothetical protein ABWX94_01895 [Candidatus Saccharimonadales bacterium]
MSGLGTEQLQQFEAWNTLGQAANAAGDFQEGLTYFNDMAQLAIDYDDPRKRLDAINPAAKSLWSLGEYNEATECLETAEAIGFELGLVDEAAMARSNMARVMASYVIKSGEVPLDDQAFALRDLAVPDFIKAYKQLEDHPHLYFRYANARHGAVVAALADAGYTARRFVAEGLRVAPQESPDYDQGRTYAIKQPGKIKPGLIQLAAALVISPLGSRTPVLADLARRRLVQ